MICLIVDPASDFSPEEAGARGMIVIPMGVTIDGLGTSAVAFRRADRR